MSDDIKQRKARFRIPRAKNPWYSFDVAWLWEEYVHTLLLKEFIHPRNKDKTDGISVFSNRERKIFPDFYHKELKIVLDAKYKKLELTEKGINREDLFQLISYAYILQAEQAGLVFPSEDKVIDNEIGKLAGYGDQLKKWSIQVPGQAESYQDFVKRIESFEKVFIENIGKDLKGKTNTG